MNCQLCDAYVPSTFDHCPACGAPVNRELPKPKQRDMLILNGEEIPIHVLSTAAYPPICDAGRNIDGTMLKNCRIIREFIVREDMQ